MPKGAERAAAGLSLGPGQPNPQAPAIPQRTARSSARYALPGWPGMNFLCAAGTRLPARTFRCWYHQKPTRGCEPGWSATQWFGAPTRWEVSTLPADYGKYGKPVILGFVGAVFSGKTHLLSAIMSEFERVRLRNTASSGAP